MNRSPRLATLCYLVCDTFRQAMAHGIFAVLLGISLLSIGICLSVSVEGPATMQRADENPDFVSRNDPDARQADKLKTSGVIVADGKLSLAFGAIQVPLARDSRGAIHFLELILAGGVADTLGLLLTLIWTAGFLPGFLEGSNIRVLLAKPAPRWMLIVGKYLGVLSFVLANAVFFVGGTWAAIGVRTGFWDSTYLLSVPLLLLHFSIFFAFSVLLAVCTHNAVVCIFGSLVLWFAAWSMNFGRHMFFTATDLAGSSLHSTFLAGLIDFGYWVLPKPADLGMMLFNAMGAGTSFASPFDFAALETQGFSMTLSVLSSLAIGAVMLIAATRSFQAADY
ncbi:MAG TPA: hypothetical protein VHV08_05835 [Pirellulales bacterium]|jgi:ABC-type transport system involved in multi-copper enzyme maturation permease subunit|nr:hypothetical protein [Pirellulales bacterium]